MADKGVRGARSANLRLLGEAHHKLEEAAEEKAVLAQAVAMNRTVLADAPDDPTQLRKLAVSLWYSAVVHRTNARDAEARAEVQEAVMLARRMTARDPNDAGGLQMVALTGGNRYNLGDTAGACRVWRETMKNYTALETRGALTAFDRNDGQPEIAGYLRDICANGKPRSAWSAQV